MVFHVGEERYSLPIEMMRDSLQRVPQWMKDLLTMKVLFHAQLFLMPASQGFEE
tara:strand:- start:305 stop:466 length:162 start_codon:yes stop_codon:yes gene_type:complete